MTRTAWQAHARALHVLVKCLMRAVDRAYKIGDRNEQKLRQMWSDADIMEREAWAQADKLKRKP